MALISQGELEARLGRSLTSEESSSFTIINNAIQAHVENIIGSSVESVSASTKLYDGNEQNLSIDPCTDVTQVKYIDNNGIGQFVYETEDYTVEPVNRTCKTMLRYRWGKFDKGMNAIEVTAKFSIFGDTSILNIVKDAILTSLEAEINNSSNIKSESIEGYSITYATTETKNALNKLQYLFPEV